MTLLSRITGGVGIFFGIGLMNVFGLSGLLFGVLFAALGGAIGAVVGSLLEHYGLANRIINGIDNILWFIVFCIPGYLVGAIAFYVALDTYILEPVKTILVLLTTFAVSVFFTLRKIKNKKLADDITDDAAQS